MTRPADIQRVHLAQIAPALGDVEANLGLHLRHVEEARRDDAGLVVFPELSLTGYLLHDLVAEVALDPRDDPRLAPLREASRDIDIVVGLVEAGRDGLAYNSGVWLAGGQVAGVHRKIYLPTYTLFDEGRYFASGDRVRAFDTRMGRTGLLVCEDFWHPALTYILAQDATDLLIVLSSSPGRGVADGGDLASQRAWHLLAESAARFHTQFVVFVGRVGVEDGHSFGGGSFVYGPDGGRLASCPLLDEASTTVTLDRRELPRVRAQNPLRRDERPEIVQRELRRLLEGEPREAGDEA